MAIELRCPNAACGKKLSVRDEYAGKTGKCPNCGAVLHIPKPGAEEVFVEPVPVRPRPAKRPPDEEEDVPARPRPAKRPPDDEEDVPVRPRRRPRADEDDDYDDEERRPARRRPRDEDEDYDDEPRPRRRARDPRVLTLVCLGIGVGLLLFLSLIPLFPLMSISFNANVPNAGAVGMTVSAPSFFNSNWHGKVILIVGIVVSLVAIGALVMYLVMPLETADLFVTIGSCVGGAWGILTLIWLAGWLWGLLRVSKVAPGIGPSIGVYIGLGVALGVAAAFSTLLNARRKVLWLYIAEGTGLLIGVLLVVLAVKPWEGGEVRAGPNPFKMYHAAPASPGMAGRMLRSAPERT